MVFFLPLAVVGKNSFRATHSLAHILYGHQFTAVAAVSTYHFAPGTLASRIFAPDSPSMPNLVGAAIREITFAFARLQTDTVRCPCYLCSS